MTWLSLECIRKIKIIRLKEWKRSSQNRIHNPTHGIQLFINVSCSRGLHSIIAIHIPAHEIHFLSFIDTQIGVIETLFMYMTSLQISKSPIYYDLASFFCITFLYRGNSKFLLLYCSSALFFHFCTFSCTLFQ